MRNENESRLGDAINDFIDRFHLREKYNQSRLYNHLGEIFGEAIARHTTRIYIKEGKLFLQIDSDPLRHELFNSRDRIVKLVNEFFGEELISEVVLR